MSWSEDDFLERLMPQLKQPHGGGNGACPDSATVLAVIEGEADEWLRNAYAQHLAQCSACLDLDTRLRNFDRPVLADEAEWKQTEKRLDNWMGAFLSSKPVVVAPQLAEHQAELPRFRRSFWRPGLVWKLSLATALLVLLAVGVDVYLSLQPEQAKVPTIGPPPPPATEPAVPGGGIPRSSPMAEAPAPAPPAQASPTVEQRETVAGVQAPPEPQQGAVKPPPTPSVQIPELGIGTKQATTAATATTKPPGVAVPTPPLQTEAAARVGTSTPVTTASAAASRRGITARSATGATTRQAAPAGPAMENVAVGRQFSQPPEAQAPPPAASLPASLHLAAGARLWLALESFNFQEDSRVLFHGSLLLPLNSTGSSALDHGTEVSGWVTSAHGQTSVLLSEIVIRGARYKLKSQAGAGNARTSGSAGAVQFDSGKVLEMWVSVDSIYERAKAE